MRAVPLILVAVALAACGSGQPQPGQVTHQEWNATLAGTGNFERLRAAVRANSVPGNTAVAIAVAGAQPQTALAWHIHSGTCASGGGIVGGAAAYSQVQVGGDGTGTANARIDVELNPGQSYHVNVHAGGQVVACGNLTR